MNYFPFILDGINIRRHIEKENDNFGVVEVDENIRIRRGNRGRPFCGQTSNFGFLVLLQVVGTRKCRVAFVFVGSVLPHPWVGHFHLGKS